MDESLTPYSDTLRDLINFSGQFEVFAKIKPILERAAAAESAVTATAATLTDLNAQVAQAQVAFDRVQRDTADALSRRDEQMKALAQRQADQTQALRAAHQRAAQEGEAKIQQLDADHAARQRQHAADMAEARDELAALQHDIAAHQQQLADARQQLDALRVMVGR